MRKIKLCSRINQTLIIKKYNGMIIMPIWIMILNFLYFTIFIFVFREHCLYFILSVYWCSIILTSSLDMKKCLSSSIIFRLGSGYKWKFNRKPKTVNCNNAFQEIKRYKTSEWKSNCRYYFSVVLQKNVPLTNHNVFEMCHR